jgi:hypothetical protein
MTAFPSLSELSSIADTIGLRTTRIDALAVMSHAFDRMIEAARARDDDAYEAAKADFYGAANIVACREAVDA